MWGYKLYPNTPMFNYRMPPQDSPAYSMMSAAVHHVVIHLSALGVGVSVTAPRRTVTTFTGVL